MIWNRHAAYALVRITLGMIFLVAGIGKFVMGIGTFANGLAERFAETMLPAGFVTGFATVLPFVEIGLGALVLVGLFTPAALVGTGVLVLVLTFGTAMLPDPPAIASNAFYAAAVAGLLWLVGANVYSLDGMRRRQEAQPSPVRREPMPPVPREGARRWTRRRTPAGKPTDGPES